MKKIKFNIPLVNAHTHAAMMPMRGIAEDLPLDVWLKKYIWPFEALHVRPKFVYENTKKAIKEMKTNGIRAFCDMYFFEEEVARAAEEEKMPVVLGEGMIDSSTPSSLTPDRCLVKTETLILKYKKHPLIKVSVAPHSIYTVCKNNLLKAKKLADKYKTIFQIHLAETKMEFDDSMKKWKMTPVQYLDSLNILDNNSLLHHCVWLTNTDIKIIAKRKANVVHCPLSNLKLGSGIAPVAKMLDEGINVALGTDGAASSNRLDIWEAGKFAALLQKGLLLNPEKIPTTKAIEMMSINGMKALKIDKIGNKDIDHLTCKVSKQKFESLYQHHVENLISVVVIVCFLYLMFL